MDPTKSILPFILHVHSLQLLLLPLSQNLIQVITLNQHLTVPTLTLQVFSSSCSSTRASSCTSSCWNLLPSLLSCISIARALGPRHQTLQAAEIASMQPVVVRAARPYLVQVGNEGGEVLRR